MVYFDYSASTTVDKEVLDNFVTSNLKYIGNANSMHKLGKTIKEEVDSCSRNILNMLKLTDDYECIYTSSSTESNNLAINGFFEKHKTGHIITTQFEHSSIIAQTGYMQNKGIRVSFVKLDKNGLVDLDDLDNLITSENTLIAIACVNSELGIKQDIQKIKQIANKHQNCYLYVDATQAIGKITLDYNYADALCFSAHKFYGIKGISCLIKRKSYKISSMIKGGTSTTKYRSGTPSHPLIMSLEFALRKALKDIDNKYQKVQTLKNYLLGQLDNVIINSTNDSIPHIVNISILSYKSKDVVLKLSEKDIYISNHSACSSTKEYSDAVLHLTNDIKRAESSIRISISHLSTQNEIDHLVKALKEFI